MYKVELRESASACIESPYMKTTVNGYIYPTPGVVKHRVTKRVPLRHVTQIACIAKHGSFSNAYL